MLRPDQPKKARTAEPRIATNRGLLAKTGEPPANRRAHPRLNTLENARVYCVLSKTYHDITIKDVSTQGLRLQAAQFFPIDSTLIIEWDFHYLSCTVRHCQASSRGWVTGVEAEPYPANLAFLAGLKESVLERNRLRPDMDLAEATKAY
jgi:hypothetical protein